MSHEDFAAYFGDGMTILGHRVQLIQGFDCLHILRLGRHAEFPLIFEPMEGFESRMNRIAATLERWTGRRQAA